MYAIIRSGGHQYRVREGDRIAVEVIDGTAGDEVTFDRVLLLDNDGAVAVGAPTVEGASVTGEIEEQFKDRKVFSLKYKNKTRQRTKRGHRQRRTRVRITSISSGA